MIQRALDALDRAETAPGFIEALEIDLVERIIAG